MTNRLLTLFAAGLLAAAPAVTHAQSISLAGGLSMPTSDLADGTQSGYNGTIGLNFGAPLIPVGARVEGSINGFNGKGSASSSSLRVLSGTANAIVGLGMPYLIGGLGYYSATVKSGIAAIGDQTESGAGFNIGAGFSFPLPSLSPFVEVRYHQMLGDNDGIKFVPITFGIKF
jgi:hypothetical protein